MGNELLDGPVVAAIHPRKRGARSTKSMGQQFLPRKVTVFKKVPQQCRITACIPTRQKEVADAVHVAEQFFECTFKQPEQWIGNAVLLRQAGKQERNIMGVLGLVLHAVEQSLANGGLSAGHIPQPPPSRLHSLRKIDPPGEERFLGHISCSNEFL